MFGGVLYFVVNLVVFVFMFVALFRMLVECVSKFLYDLSVCVYVFFVSCMSFIFVIYGATRLL